MFIIRSRNKAFTSQERQEYGMKIAIVTGASSGMGREAVIQLADRFGEEQTGWKSCAVRFLYRFEFFLWICRSLMPWNSLAGS